MFWDKYVNKLSDKAFASEEFQKSWKVHMDAFAPILEPAFAKDSGSRLNLVAALNTISRGDYKNGKKKLLAIKKACKTDADKAAWAYFMGLLYERSGERQQMISHYSVSCRYDHRFYLPYLKLAKCAMEETLPDIAEENYRKALDRLDEMPAGQAEQKYSVRAATYANLAGCLLTMRRLDEAAALMEKAMKMQPENTGLLATQAMIHAAGGRSAEALDALDALQKDQPKLAETSRRVVESILNNQNSHFCILPAREDLFDDFWKAFAEKAGKLRQLYETDEDSRAIAMLEKMFAPLFPFPGEEVSFRLKMNPQNQMALDLIDGYSLSLEAGIEKLLEKCPPEIKAGWAIHSAH